MYKTWGRIQIRIWIGIKVESRIRIRIGINTMLRYPQTTTRYFLQQKKLKHIW
jgi:hypothetical protein